ncbi:DUF4333 domain-containing protein [Streptomyces sp. NPDC048420]|uniref:DUF4333 domain-containing protein n=1 Tax=Streptomyces sp. NPDC048420 TaxID=3155755 RepID=UPI00342FDC86
MAMPRPLVTTAVISAVTASMLLVGCSATANVEKSEPKLSADKLATTLAKKLAATTGQPTPDVTCPEDLTGKAGTTTRCTLTTGDGSTLGVTVTVSSVEGDQINFNFEADDKASPAS